MIAPGSVFLSFSDRFIIPSLLFLPHPIHCPPISSSIPIPPSSHLVPSISFHIFLPHFRPIHCISNSVKFVFQMFPQCASFLFLFILLKQSQASDAASPIEEDPLKRQAGAYGPCCPPAGPIGCAPPIAALPPPPAAPVPPPPAGRLIPQALPGAPCEPGVECTGGSVCSMGICLCPPELVQEGTVCVSRTIYGVVPPPAGALPPAPAFAPPPIAPMPQFAPAPFPAPAAVAPAFAVAAAPPVCPPPFANFRAACVRRMEPRWEGSAKKGEERQETPNEKKESNKNRNEKTKKMQKHKENEEKEAAESSEEAEDEEEEQQQQQEALYGTAADDDPNNNSVDQSVEWSRKKRGRR